MNRVDTPLRPRQVPHERIVIWDQESASGGPEKQGLDPSRPRPLRSGQVDVRQMSENEDLVGLDYGVMHQTYYPHYYSLTGQRLEYPCADPKREQLAP